MYIVRDQGLQRLRSNCHVLVKRCWLKFKQLKFKKQTKLYFAFSFLFKVAYKTLERERSLQLQDRLRST